MEYSHTVATCESSRLQEAKEEAGDREGAHAQGWHTTTTAEKNLTSLDTLTAIDTTHKEIFILFGPSNHEHIFNNYYQFKVPMQLSLSQFHPLVVGAFFCILFKIHIAMVW